MFILRWGWRLLLVAVLVWALASGGIVAGVLWWGFLGYCVVKAWPAFWRLVRPLWDFGGRRIRLGSHYGRLRGDTL